MKKAIFILVVFLFVFSAKGQNTDTIFNDYFLPNYIKIDHCGTENFFTDYMSVLPDFSNNLNLDRGHYYFAATGGSWYSEELERWVMMVLDRAQPCYTDTLLTIKGVAIGLGTQLQGHNLNPKLRAILPQANDEYNDNFSTQDIFNIYDTLPKGKIKIMDGTLGREITFTDIDTSCVYFYTEEYQYIEYYFENPVNVNGLFWIVEDVTNTSTRLFEMVLVKDCYAEWPSLVRTAETDSIENPWVEWEQHPFNTITHPLFHVEDTASTYKYYPPDDDANDLHIPSTCQMYMFPIFAETDSTLGDGINFDTNDTTDMCLYDATVDRYSNVSPNPANDVVTVQSSFKIREIEIHNSLGQVVLRKEGKQNIETIDVSHLESGMYIVRIKTQRGFANKKVIIQ